MKRQFDNGDARRANTNSAHTGRKRVFISYSACNRRRARRLASVLRMHGIDVWYDRWEVLVGHDIHAEVYSGILRCDYLAVVLTQASLQSRWVQEELGIARQKEFEQRKVVILPLLYENVVLPLHLKKKRYADFRNFEGGLQDILRILDVPPMMHIPSARDLSAIHRAISDVHSLKKNTLSRLVTSFAESRLMADCAMAAGSCNESIPTTVQSLHGSPMTVFVELESTPSRLPLRVSSGDTARSVLLTLERIVGFPLRLDVSEAGHSLRSSFFLFSDGYPLELESTLQDAGVQDGSCLKLGCYLLAIE